MLSITYISTVCIVCLKSPPPHYNANANASGNYLIGWDSSGLRWLAKCLQTLPKRSRLILLTPSDFHLHKLSRAMWLPVTRFCEILPHSINSSLIFIQICSQPTKLLFCGLQMTYFLNSVEQLLKGRLVFLVALFEVAVIYRFHQWNPFICSHSWESWRMNWI